VTPKRRVVILIGLVTGLPVAFLVGRGLRPASVSGPASRDGLRLSASSALSDRGPRDLAASRTRPSPRSIAPPAASPAPTESTLTATARMVDAAVARQTVQALLSQVGTPSAISNPEDATAMKRAFLSGWLDAVRYTSSSLIEGIGTELRDRLCQGVSNDAEGMFIAHILQMAPEVATPEGFQCYFSQPPSAIVPLVTMLEAWRNSELAPVPALENIKNTIQDSRVQSVFAPVVPHQEAELAPE
jgi:hypothetical protein